MVGRTVRSVEVFGPRTLRRHGPGPADFIARVQGRRVIAARRRGKYLWLPVAGAGGATEERGWGPATSAEGATGEWGWGPATSAEGAGHEVEAAVVAHLGMSGQFLAVPPGSP